jgi:hypothetical protein
MQPPAARRRNPLGAGSAKSSGRIVRAGCINALRQICDNSGNNSEFAKFPAVLALPRVNLRSNSNELHANPSFSGTMEFYPPEQPFLSANRGIHASEQQLAQWSGVAREAGDPVTEAGRHVRRKAENAQINRGAAVGQESGRRCATAQLGNGHVFVRPSLMTRRRCFSPMSNRVTIATASP